MEDAPAPRLEAFVFDLDGTLFDTLPDLVALTNAVLRECGYPERTTREILGFVGNGVKALMYQAVPDNADADDVEAAMTRWKALYPEYGHRLTKAYEGIPETIAELKRRGAKLGVLSNKFDEGVQDVIGTLMPGRFSVAHGERADIPRKPDPTGLRRTPEELGASPATTAYVGDSTGDIAVARNAGTFAIAVAWGYHDRGRLEAARPDALIEHAADLLRFAPGA